MSEKEQLHWSGETTVTLREGTAIVNAYATDVPGLVVHLAVADPDATTPSGRHSDYWNVTHVNSGLALIDYIDGFGEAQSKAREFGGIIDWTTFDTADEFKKLITPELRMACRAIRDGAA